MGVLLAAAALWPMSASVLALGLDDRGSMTRAPEREAVQPAALCRAAVDSLRSAHRGLPVETRLDARCDANVPRVEFRAGGRLELRAQARDRALLDGWRTVDVEVLVDARVEKVVRVPVQLTIEVPQWCARESVMGGQPTTEQRFAPCARPLRSVDQLQLADGRLPSGRVIRAMRAGDTLVPNNLAEETVALRGDPVTVLYRSGAIALESTGELVHDGRIGEEVHVRLRGSTEPLVGRLSSARQVDITLGNKP